MRKSFFGSALLLLLLCLFSFRAYAADSVGADIPVSIEGGGTAIITAEVNCPLPTVSQLDIENGKTGHFHINFTEPGTYRYTVSVKDGENAYTPASCSVTVSVNSREDGSYYTVTVIRKQDAAEKSDEAAFVRTESTTVPPTEPPTVPPDEQSRPVTGDESDLELYLLLAIAAAAGLFGLSLIYAHGTKKYLAEKQQKTQQP